MARSTQVAAALNALVDALQAQLLPGVVLIDGPPRSIDDPDVVVVGFSPSAADVEVAQEFSDLGGGRDERLTINCLASSRRGEHDPATMRVVRTRAVELIDWVLDVLESDPSLDDLVASAELGLVSALDHAAHEKGTDATVEFTVLVEVL